ncbi:TPA: hypothetical protein HH295_19745 [Xanthomonas vasicola pv. zeae]|uniref:Uncharacterized protein n=3 Tax=Xanthomonas vasicola TaxID=56459 RepID=A0A836P2M3_XANVA|nr:hypothetical protein C7V42_12990 [Xanthomonas vasicola pv. vasculorum]AZR22652.1 hypothetical protein NX81_010320 [Xanthomonas vasicola]AZR27504.1 hypothetical protein NX80_014720 [Xanthomonas vasicola pv. arecae]AZR30707.1 hypothetical protein KWO_009360 [Xanthomonas vasicola pv. musacearum NCPPB 4379]KFA04379.1 hypothetical protein KWQ_0121485 [Xanthomonas vasicola pv. musacearum NCPPB 4380]KFA09431.1 hypothetical protein KWM_0110970 [Xanthomonas vasicola pv. musacearum NCPPB 2005]KFA182
MHRTPGEPAECRRNAPRAPRQRGEPQLQAIRADRRARPAAADDTTDQGGRCNASPALATHLFHPIYRGRARTPAEMLLT